MRIAKNHLLALDSRLFEFEDSRLFGGCGGSTFVGSIFGLLTTKVRPIELDGVLLFFGSSLFLESSLSSS